MERGAQLGRYTIQEFLGGGGFGRVYLATQQGPAGFARVVALKLLRPALQQRAPALQAFARPLPSTMTAAQDFQAGLDQVQALPPGQAFQWAYTENGLSSYLHFILGPQIGFDARARFLSSDEVAFQGNWSGMLGLPVTVVTRMETDSPQLYHTVSAAVQILPLSNSNFGWVPLPVSAVQPLVDAINQDIGQGYIARAIDFPPFKAVVNGESAPPLDAPLRIVGISD